MRSRVRGLFGPALLLAVVPALAAGADFTWSSHHRTAVDERQPEFPSVLAGAAASPAQTRVVRTTGGIDTTGWVLIAFVQGPDAALLREGQPVRAFSINARTRVHLARVTRVTRRQSGVRVEATLEERVLGVATRYLMEIATDTI